MSLELVCSKVKVIHKNPEFDGRIAVVYRYTGSLLSLCFLDSGRVRHIACTPRQAKVLGIFEPEEARLLAISHGTLGTLECFDRPPYRK